jgi:hypothetical protein
MYTVEKISNWDIRVDIQTNKPCQLYVDTFPSSPKQCLRVLWSVEPNEIAGLRDIVINRHKEFDLILTWHKEVLDNCSNARLFPHGMSWILDFDLTKEKEYCITSIVGGKTITQYQIMRQGLPKINEMVSTIPIHLFNSKNEPYTGTPLIDRYIQDSEIKNELFYSQFHIAIENMSSYNWFTEKLIDCFQTKTIPIYLGCPNIGDFFDTRGMFIVKNLDDITNVCNSITTETYHQMLPYIQENYERSFKYAKFRESLRDKIIDFVKNH